MNSQTDSPDGSFRDRITTVDERGKRKWLFPKRPKGRLYTYRIWLSYLLLLIFFLTPWLRIDGEPVMMLDVIRRKFVLFGQVFWPQDFHLFVLIMILMIVFIVAFTVIYGRIFCGWLCPQTIFMEMVYRRIEYWIDGDSRAQRKLREAPWTAGKIARRSLKYTVFYLLALIISYTFLAYIIGTEHLLETLASPLSERLGGFIAILIFSLVFFFVYAWFREQVCLIVCPYGRLQGVMLDRNSVVVAYDYVRGEGKTGRAKFRSEEDRRTLGKGDCIDCNQCVDVCPTGIDIRNGVQLECINCTACMDACDHMMDSTRQPRGLIRLASENSIAGGTPWKMGGRAIAYSLFLLILTAAIVFLFSLRGSLEATILRTPGISYQEREGGLISNLYNVKVVNKSNHPMDLGFTLEGIPGTIEMVGNPVMRLEKGESSQQAFFVVIPRDALKGIKTEIEIGVYSNGRLLETNSTNFLGP